MFNIHGWQDLESFLKILIILFGIVKAGPSLVRTAKDWIQRISGPKSTKSNNTSQKGNYIETENSDKATEVDTAVKETSVDIPNDLDEPKSEILEDNLNDSTQTSVKKKNGWICDQIVLKPLNQKIQNKFGDKIILPRRHWNSSNPIFESDGYLSYKWSLIESDRNKKTESHCSFDICIHRKNDKEISINLELRRRSDNANIIEMFNTFSPSAISILQEFEREERKNKEDENTFLFLFKDVVSYPSSINANDKELVEKISEKFIPALDEILKVFPTVS